MYDYVLLKLNNWINIDYFYKYKYYIKIYINNKFNKKYLYIRLIINFKNNNSFKTICYTMYCEREKGKNDKFAMIYQLWKPRKFYKKIKIKGYLKINTWLDNQLEIRIKEFEWK